jgi:hypothetical protein
VNTPALSASCTQTCPSWCRNTHSDEFSVHTRACGEIYIDYGSYTVELAQYEAYEAPMVALSLYREDEARVSNLTAAEARQLHAALETALTFMRE